MTRLITISFRIMWSAFLKAASTAFLSPCSSKKQMLSGQLGQTGGAPSLKAFLMLETDCSGS